MQLKFVPYEPRFREDFIEMNRNWIERMFALEEEDLKLFDHLEEHLDQGARIYFLVDEEAGNRPCATVLLTPKEHGEWEIEKFASRQAGTGSLLLQEVLNLARKEGIPRLFLVTNTACEAAIHLYRKYGFTEIPVDPVLFPYERSNIAFELLPDRTL